MTGYIERDFKEAYIRMKERALNAEAVLRSIANNTCCEGCQEAAKVARAALTIVCETCGGAGEIDQRLGGIGTSATVPCPDCAHTPTEGGGISGFVRGVCK